MKIIKFYIFAFISILLTLNFNIAFSQQEDEVMKHEFSSEIQFEKVLSGKLTELNGKYKIRISKNIYQPGGYIGDHHHAGPGVRLILSGELTYVENDTTTIFHEGDYFYEPGDITHKGYNKTDLPVIILSFEILPAEWKGSSTTNTHHK